MWSTKDESCVEMALEFYGPVKDGFAKDIDNWAVAMVLHDSILKVRSASRRRPLPWAPYVHLGA